MRQQSEKSCLDNSAGLCAVGVHGFDGATHGQFAQQDELVVSERFQSLQINFIKQQIKQAFDRINLGNGFEAKTRFGPFSRLLPYAKNGFAKNIAGELV
jgi:hypothetical protein